MIKKFDNFLIEELNPQTYRNAAHFMNKLGGKHSDRAKALFAWSRRPELSEYGVFNINMNAYSRETSKGMNIEFRGYKSKQSYELELVKQGPIECTLSDIEIIDPLDNYSSDDVKKSESIFITFYFIPTDQELEANYATDCFVFDIRIKWEKEGFDDIMRVSHIIVSGNNDTDDKYLFSDRKSAWNFKKKVLNKESLLKTNKFKRLRDFFMEYSTALELEKFFTLLSSISINKLYQ